LLDIGAGIGALTFELLDRGITEAVVVEASPAYLAASRDEAICRHQETSVRFVGGDFLNVAATTMCLLIRFPGEKSSRP
jgi:16S rRNA A1518/A1519 N6-dimethyltransferase RsmA/KsgA/DIM1 with predicted DNA glycosylase/AP lyase activity